MANTLVKVVVAAISADGVPDFYAAVIKCSNYQYNNGEHYDEAREKAFEEGYESPMVAFDEKDGPHWLFTKFDWTQLTPIDITVYGEFETGEDEDYIKID